MPSSQGETAVCPHCEGMGFVMPDLAPGQEGFGRAIPCVCKKQELDDKKAENLVRISQMAAMRHLTFDTFLPQGVGLPPDKVRNLNMAHSYAQEFARNPEGWLLLKGGYGCGKTHLAAAIANDRLDRNQSTLFVNTPDLLDHLRGTYAPSSTVTYDQRFEEVRNTELLILDDFGAHNNSDWAQEKLYQILNFRYTGRLPTVITTNEELESIEIRVRSRLSDLSFVQRIDIVAPDYRRGGVYQEESDLSLLHLHSDKTFGSFDRRGDELTRGQATNLQRAVDLMQQFAHNPQGWIILNSSAYGNGKTHLAAATANHVSQQGKSVLFISTPDLLDRLRDTFDSRTSARLSKRFHEIKTVGLLVLDDLGTENATPFAREKLYQLFNYRYDANLPTIITTATPVDEIDPRLAARFLDGAKSTFFLLEVPSYRGGGRKRTPNQSRPRR